GLPSSLVGIDVEVVERAVAWLLRRDDVLDQPVAVLGMSRGSELALYAGVLLDGVGPVVGLVPSGVGWPGLDASGPVDAAAWRFRGRDLPFAVLPRPEVDIAPAPTEPIALRPMFEAALDHWDAVSAAEIPVEQVHGPVLLVSGEADAL